MSHDHDHSHSVPANFSTSFAIGIGLNLAFVAIETIYGFLSNSLALLADAGHNLSDVGGLALAWAAAYMASKPPSKKFTYGFRRSSILAAFLNAIILLVAVGAIALESIRRFNQTIPVAENTVIWVAAIGILINSFTALLFLKGRHRDINIKGAYLHMVADAAVSAGVVIAGFAIKYTGWMWLDSIVSLSIAVVITIGTWSLFRDSLKMSLDAVPSSIDANEVQTFLQTLPSVSKVHDLHIWPMSTTEVALTAHLVKPKIEDEDNFLHDLAHSLEHKFGINHSTVQIERGVGLENCHLEPDDIV